MILADYQNQVTGYYKNYTAADIEKWNDLDVLFVFAGRARPTQVEMDAELVTLSHLVYDAQLVKHVIYISSEAIDRDTDYGQHKRRCEAIIGADIKLTGRWTVVRPPATFGPTQPLESTMLIPSLKREGVELDIREPDMETDFIYVGHLCNSLIGLVQDGPPSDGPRYVGSSMLPGTFTATPDTLRNLWATWHLSITDAVR